MSSREASQEVSMRAEEESEAAASDADMETPQLPAGYACARDRICIEKQDGRLVELCGPVRVRCLASTEDGAEWYLRVRFQSADGYWREAAVPRQDLVLSPSRVARVLLGKGFDLRGTPRELCKLLLAMEPDARGRAISETGWVGANFSSYVAPDGAVLTARGVAETDLKSVFTGEVRHPGGARDTLEAWQSAVIGTAPSQLALLGVCIGFAPVVMSSLAQPSFLLHLIGPQQTNVVAKAVAASVWGAPGALECSWQQPVAQLVDAIAGARDSLVILSGYEPRHARKLAAVLDALSARDSKVGDQARVLILSTGSGPLLQDVGKGVDTGDIIELDLASAPGAEADAGTDPEAVLAATSSNYGTAGPAFVEAFMRFHRERGQSRDFLQMRCDDILDVLFRDRALADQETRRACDALGVLFGAGKLAVNRGVLPKKLPLEELFRRLAKAWRSRCVGLLSEDDHRALIGMAGTLRDLARTALVSLDQEVAIPAEGPGWQDAQHLYLAPDTLTQLATTHGYSRDRVLVLLREQGVLVPGNERGLQFRMPSRVAGRPRAYRVSRQLLRFAPTGLDV